MGIVADTTDRDEIRSLDLIRATGRRTGPSGVLRIIRLNSGPSRTRSLLPGRRMPHLTATDRAVLTLSPVTMRTVMPAR